MPERYFDALDVRDGNDPTEEVQAHECDVDVALTEVPPPARGDEPQNCQYLPSDEIAEQMELAEVRMGTSLLDGLPVPLDEGSMALSTAPAFTVDNVICIEDASTYVEVPQDLLRDGERRGLAHLDGPRARRERSLRWLGLACGANIALAAVLWLAFDAPFGAFLCAAGGAFAGIRAFWPDRLPPHFGARHVLASDRLAFAPEDVQTRAWGPAETDVVHVARVRDALALPAGGPAASPEYVIVRPRREACSHYRRQVLANDDVEDGQPGRRLIFRNCMMRRSVGGAFMSLRDEAVFACDYRDPPTLASKALADSLDADILRKSAERQMVSLFNISKKPTTKDD